MSETRRHDAIALAALTACITLLFADVLLGFNSLHLRDIVHYYYPAKHLLREIVLNGDFPAWNPWFNGGQPMAANPEHEVFYPLTWLILLPGYRFWFHLLMIGHLYIAGWSMYALLRSMRSGSPAAFIGALSFAIGGLALSYLNLLPILFSIAWLPLTCLYVRRFLLRRAKRDFALASFFFGLQVLVGEPSTLLQTGLLLGLYAIWAGWQRGRVRGALNAVAMVGLLSIAALMVGAVQMLPAADHAASSVRARGLSFEHVISWSMPPIRIAELLHPNLLGHTDTVNHEFYWGRSLYKGRSAPFLFSIYPGLLLTVLAIGGLFTTRGRGLALAVLVISILLAMGSHTPLWQFLFDIGLARSLRYPEKFILLGVFVITVFGARVLDSLLSGNADARRAVVRTALVVSILTVCIGLFARTGSYAELFQSAWDLSPRRLEQVLAVSATGWLLVGGRSVIVLLLLRNAQTARRAIWIGLAGGFTLLDLGAIMPESVPRMPAEYYDPPDLARRLPDNRQDYRVFHHANLHTSKPEVAPYFVRHADAYWIPRNAMFPPIPTQHGIRLALESDYDLTLLLATEDYAASIIDLTFLSKDWVDIAASMSNIWYRLVFIAPDEAFALAQGDRRRVQPVGIISLRKYPRYYFAAGVETVRTRKEFVAKLADPGYVKGTALINGPGFDPAAGVVHSAVETANTVRLEVEAAGRSFLVMSVTPHKYWRVTIDGTETPAIVTNVGYQGIVVPPGRHVVEMRYHNPLIPIGGAVTLGALLCIAFLVGRRPSRHNAPA